MSRSDLVYEFAVIGGGLIGSSAARHLSGLSPGGGPVCAGLAALAGGGRLAGNIAPPRPSSACWS